MEIQDYLRVDWINVEVPDVVAFNYEKWYSDDRQCLVDWMIDIEHQSTAVDGISLRYTISEFETINIFTYKKTIRRYCVIS